MVAKWEMLLLSRMGAERLLQSGRRDGGGGWRQQMEKKCLICIEKHMGGKITQLSTCQMGRVQEVSR